MITNDSIRELKPYTMKELCKIYQISDKTLRKWLQPFATEIGKRNGNIYTVAQVQVIFKNLGVPGLFEE